MTINSKINLAQEFEAALEASLGQNHKFYLKNPMDSITISKAYSRILLSKWPDFGLCILERTGALKATLPEVAQMVGFGDDTCHKNVWKHTLKVVRQCPPRLLLRWGALLHDIGKIQTRKFENGKVTFLGHPEVGARMFAQIASRFQIPPLPARHIEFLIVAHLRAASYQKDWTDSAVRRFIKFADSKLLDLLDLARADITSKYDEKVLKGLKQINDLLQRIKKLKKTDAQTPLIPTGLGTVLISELSILPGPKLGALIKNLKQEIISQKIKAQQDPQYYVEYAKKHLLN